MIEVDSKITCYVVAKLPDSRYYSIMEVSDEDHPEAIREFIKSKKIKANGSDAWAFQTCLEADMFCEELNRGIEKGI